MYIQEVVSFANFDPDLLDCYRALGVDMIQLDLRAEPWPGTATTALPGPT